ncbi:MAG: glycosyltransferase [Candidatus Fimadaptatus sp.]|jgi:glycosyltransferase involved in cell wall biosynthesis
MDYIVLIPAYKPDMRLVTLVDELEAEQLPVLVVDDGSTEEQRSVFAALEERGITVLRHAVNQGKGRAMKTGFNYLMVNHPELKGVVTADCDGQHTPDDIKKVLSALREHPDDMIIGARKFTGDVPARSLIGNKVTRGVFWFATGIHITDTQTGLRGFPMNSLPRIMKLSGERYELEMNMLLALKDWDMHATEVPIETIYIDENASSHFSAVRDGMRIFRQIIKYIFSSMASWGVDYGVYILLLLLPWKLPEEICHIVARVCSSLLNYKINQKAVFHARTGKREFALYVIMVAVTLSIGTPLLALLTRWGMNALIAKMCVDTVMFFFNYLVQREIIFRRK